MALNSPKNSFVNGLGSQTMRRYMEMSPETIVDEVLEGKNDMEGMYYLLMEKYRPLMIKNMADFYPKGQASNYLDDMIYDFWLDLYGKEEEPWKKLRQLENPKAFGSWLSTTSYRYFLAQAKKEKADKKRFDELEQPEVYAEDPEERERELEWDQWKAKAAVDVLTAVTLIKNPLEQFAISSCLQEESTENIMAGLTKMKREKDPTAKAVSRDYVYVLIGRAKEKIREYVNRENDIQL